MLLKTEAFPSGTCSASMLLTPVDLVFSGLTAVSISSMQVLLLFNGSQVLPDTCQPYSVNYSKQKEKEHPSCRFL